MQLANTEKIEPQAASDLNWDRGGVNQAYTGVGVFDPVEFNNRNRDTLREWIVGAGNWYFQPRRAGLYLVSSQVASTGGGAAYTRNAIRFYIMPDPPTPGIVLQMHYISAYRAPPILPDPPFAKLAVILWLTPRNRLQVHAETDSNVNINGSINFTWLHIARLT